MAFSRFCVPQGASFDSIEVSTLFFLDDFELPSEINLSKMKNSTSADHRLVKNPFF